MFRMRKKQHVRVLLEVILWIKRCDDTGGRGEACWATLFNRLRGGDASTGSDSAGAGLLVPRRRRGSVPTGMEVSTRTDMAVEHWCFYLDDLNFLR